MSSNSETPPVTTASVSKDYAAVFGTLVAIITLLIFGRAVSFGFVDWDDSTNVFNNRFYFPVTFGSIAQFWWKPFHELFTPVTNTLWGICCLIARRSDPIGVLGSGNSYFDPMPFHALGILFHAATAVFVYLLLIRLTRNTEGSAIGALFWAIHPLQVESVVWVTGNNNVFSGFFGVLALWAYVRSIQKATIHGSGSPGMALPTVFYILALLGKPTAVAVPLIAAVIDALILRRAITKWLPLVAFWSVLAVGLAILTHASSGASSGVTIALWKRPIIVLDGLAFYLGRILYPATLAVDYGRLPDLVVHSLWGYLYACISIVVAAVCMILWRRDRARQPLSAWWPLAAFGIFVAGVFPMSGIVPYYFMKVSTVADRYVYLALIGPAFALAALVAAVRSNRTQTITIVGRNGVVGAIAVVAVLPYAVRTCFQLPVWHDSISLFSHAVAANPDSAIAHNNLGVALADRSQYDAALTEALRVRQMKPGDANATNNLGVAFGENGDREQAIAAFREAIRQRPDFPGPHYHLGVTLADANDFADAVGPLQDAVRLQPNFTEAWFRLGIALGKCGRLPEAVDALATDLKQRPGDMPAHYMRGVLLGNLKRYTEAETEFMTVTKAVPTTVDAWSGLGTVRERLGDRSGARTAFSQLLRLDPTNAAAKAALGRLLP